MRVAAIDCGTNSIRLLVADIQENGFREVHRDMQIVRLGAGVDKNKAFDPDAITRTLAATQDFARIIASKGAEKIRFCATSATRDASNRALFIDGVRQILGIEPEVIPGSEEAALSFLGATKELGADLTPHLVVDIGGGSTEFVLGSGKVEYVRSVNIGCVRMSERHLNIQPPSEQQIQAATTVAAAALGLSEYDRYSIHLSRISADKVHEVAKMFASMNREEIAALGYMHPGRVDVITSGSLVLSRVMKATGASEFVASESDILDGIAWSLAK